MELLLERDPVLFVRHYYDMSRPEARRKYGACGSIVSERFSHCVACRR